MKISLQRVVEKVKLYLCGIVTGTKSEACKLVTDSELYWLVISVTESIVTVVDEF